MQIKHIKTDKNLFIGSKSDQNLNPNPMKTLLDPNLFKSEGDRWRCKALLQSRADQNGGKFERRRNAENIGSFSPIVAAATDQKCGAC